MKNTYMCAFKKEYDTYNKNENWMCSHKQSGQLKNKQ